MSAVALLLIASCGNDASTSDPDGAGSGSDEDGGSTVEQATTTTIAAVEIPDACELLTRVDAESIMGFAVEPHMMTTERRCVWVAAQQVESRLPTIALLIRATDFDEARFEAVRPNVSEGGEALDIGDLAYIHDDGQSLAVNVLVESVWFAIVTTDMIDVEAVRRVEEAAAQIVTGRL